MVMGSVDGTVAYQAVVSKGRLLMRGMKLLAGLSLAALILAPLSVKAQDAVFVGSATCGECHPDEYENFSKYAKKAHSARSIKIMASDLTEEELDSCFVCHTTGYGQPGGFVSFEETPDLADAGCEVCHGAGSEHVDTGGDPSLIKGDLSMADCESCHSEERVNSFDFKPLLYGGAH